MADMIRNEVTNVVVTEYVAKTSRTRKLHQVVNVALNGLAHVQNVGAISYQTTVNFVIHQSNDNLLLAAWHDGDLVKVVDGDNERFGYIIGLVLDDDYADGFHKGTIVIQEEVAA